MAIDGYCQNGSCKKKASVRVFAKETTMQLVNGVVGLPVVSDRALDLCPEDADYFLSIRDSEKPNPKRIEKFVSGCHRN